MKQSRKINEVDLYMDIAVDMYVKQWRRYSTEGSGATDAPFDCEIRFSVVNGALVIVFYVSGT